MMKASDNLHLHGPIPSWDEGLPLGNGALGCLVWGPLENLRFSLDKAGLWDLTPAPETLRTDFTYETMCRYVAEQKWGALKALFDAPYSYATPTKLPVGAVTLSGLPEMPYDAELSLPDATASICWEDGSLNVWMAAAAPLLVLEAETPAYLSLAMHPPAYGQTENPFQDHLCRALAELNYPAPVLLADGFLQEISDDRCYCVLTRKIVTEGKTVFLITAADGAQGDDLLRQCRTLLYQADWAALRKAHEAWWSDYWRKSGISIPSEALEQIWYRGNYLLGSGSRLGEAPMPLQGVWTANQNALPPWKGDYHNDLNTQFTYSGYLTANHHSQGSAFLEYLWQLLPAARRFAKAFYGTEGICFPGVMALDGSPLGGWPMYSLSPTNTVWLCQLFYEHYRITGDPDFLRHRVWPVFLDCERCIGSLLTADENGCLCLPLSSSPEINDDSPASWLTPDSNYDLALLRYLYETLLKMARVLHEPEEYWAGQLALLPMPLTEEDGTLMIGKNLSIQESHRHFSHAMSVYPLRQITPGTPENENIINNTISRLESLGTSQWVGFSFVWYALLKIIQKDGAGAEKALLDFSRGFLSPNGFHLNGDYRKLGLSNFHYRPFTLEANMLAVQAVSEMLLYSQGGEIEVFPAVPKHWNALSFSGLCGENGLILSAEKKNGVTTVTMYARQAGSWHLRNTNKIISLRQGETTTQIWRNSV